MDADKSVGSISLDVKTVENAIFMGDHTMLSGTVGIQGEKRKISAYTSGISIVVDVEGMEGPVGTGIFYISSRDFIGAIVHLIESDPEKFKFKSEVPA